MKILFSTALLLMYWGSNVSAQAVGFDQMVLYANSDRPLKTSIWYPTEEKMPSVRIADNMAFLGTDVVRVAQPSTGIFPVVIISHGYRGNWRNQNWLATKLAQDGYVVAALDHPGTTSFDHSPKSAAQWWQRPKDLSRLLDWLLDSSMLRTAINDDVTAIGHSLGGWTVMALAGAQFDRDQLKQECIAMPNPRTCGLMPELGLDKPQVGELAVSLKNSLKDQRIKRVISLDLGLARSLSRDSLRKLETPTLILAAGVDIGNLPQAEESGFLAQYIPKTKHEYRVYSDAAHFSFMQLCKSGAIVLIEEEEEGAGIVCKDGGKRSREDLHQAIYQDILSFLRQS